MNNGYVLIHRKMLDNPVVCKDNDYFRVWLYLLLNATYTEHCVVFDGKKISLQPGQFITSRKSLAEKCGIHESKVQRILKTFEIEHQIEQRTCNQNRLITILNWRQYQSGERQFGQPANSKRTTSEQPVNTNNKGLREKNNGNAKKYSDADVAYAKRWGLTIEEYASRVEELRRR